MTDEQKTEMYSILKEAGLENLVVKRDDVGEYLDLVLRSRPYISKGDWKVNIKSALQDMAAAATSAHERFVKVID